MRAAKLHLVLFIAALSFVAPAAALGAPSVVFSTTTLDVSPSTAHNTPSVVVQNPGDLSQVDLDIAIPVGLTLDTTESGTGLACVTPGTGTSMFFASWNSAERKIEISCIIGASGHVVESIHFTTGASVSLQEITLLKPNRGSWPLGSTFGTLTLQPPHTVTISAGPTVNPAQVDPHGQTSCSATASDSLGHAVSYKWSASVAGGSFSNDAIANPTYTAPANTTGSNITVVLSCTASCPQNAAIKDVETVNLTVRSHSVTITSGPTLTPSTVKAGATTNCTVTAADSLGGAVTYLWSDGGAGGSFNSTTAQNPVYTAPGNTTGANKSVTITCLAKSAADATVTKSGTATLTVQPHTVAITAGPTLTPDVVGSGGQTACSVTAVDSNSHAVTYQWSDGGAGGSFSSATAANPTYTAPANNTGTDTHVTITCAVACSEDATLTDTETATLTVSTLPPKTVTVTTTPAVGVSIAFGKAEVGAKTSPQTSNFTLSYREGTTGVTLTAPVQSGGDHPRWFTGWTLNDAAQQAGARTITFDIGTANHTAAAVYGGLVGDIDEDGDVDKADADMILQALFEDVAETAKMDVNQDGTKDANGNVTAPKVDLNDARWILLHTYEGA